MMRGGPRPPGSSRVVEVEFEGGGAVGGAKQDREGELGGAGIVVSPAKAIRKYPITTA